MYAVLNVIVPADLILPILQRSICPGGLPTVFGGSKWLESAILILVTFLQQPDSGASVPSASADPQHH